MKLDRVTITGADNSVHPLDLYELSQRFPFVEWGILVRKSYAWSPRFPSPNWIKELMGPTSDMQFSLHVCGEWVREILVGLNVLPEQLLLYDIKRVQLNFHAEDLPFIPARCCEALAKFGNRQIIFQIDGNRGQEYIAGIEGEGPSGFDCVPLFDKSHGAGVLAKDWPQPFDEDTYHGYAGGLGPDNLAEQIPLIGAAAGNTRIWIDMETNVRSDYGRKFDLEMVERCLEIAKPFISQ